MGNYHQNMRTVQRALRSDMTTSPEVTGDDITEDFFRSGASRELFVKMKDMQSQLTALHSSIGTLSELPLDTRLIDLLINHPTVHSPLIALYLGEFAEENLKTILAVIAASGGDCSADAAAGTFTINVRPSQAHRFFNSLNASTSNGRDLNMNSTVRLRWIAFTEDAATQKSKEAGMAYYQNGIDILEEAVAPLYANCSGIFLKTRSDPAACMVLSAKRIKTEAGNWWQDEQLTNERGESTLAGPERGYLKKMAGDLYMQASAIAKEFTPPQ